MSQAAFAQTTFTGTDWSEFSYSADGATFEGARYACADDDIDNDNDGLIEVCYLDDLNAIRYQLRGTAYQSTSGAMPTSQGCPLNADSEPRCRGYELVRDLDFTADDSYRNTGNKMKWTAPSDWVPIGDEFRGIFEGNGHTVSSLHLFRSGTYNGLFARLAREGTINGIGLLSVGVSGSQVTGGLVGESRGTISNSYSSGRVAATTTLGGLVGENNGIISNSYSSGQVSGFFAQGGLVGENKGMISNSYSTAQVGSILRRSGGLVGWNTSSGTIGNSYSIGTVTASSQVGGLVGENNGTVSNNSYWDITKSKRATSAGGTGKTTSELQTPTNASGIYSTWKTSWDFGASIQYPAVEYTAGSNINYPIACGISQQPTCASLLGHQRIRRVTISMQTPVRVDVVEGETVILDASRGNFNYSWVQTSGTLLSLETTNTAELRFVVPSNLVGKEATTGSLMFQLAVSTGTMSVSQTVLVVVTKINNGDSTTALKPITRSGNVLTASPIGFLVDADGAGSTSTIRYRWQLCLAGEDCSRESINWTNTSGTARSYPVEGAEARANNRFRVVAEYRDGQGYAEQFVISNPISYSLSSVFLATTFTGMSWSQFVGGAQAVCDDGDIDNDNDGLIELCYLENIDAIRYVLDGSGSRFSADAGKNTQGCGPGGCRGYELVRDLDFEGDNSYLNTKNKPRWTSATEVGWQPIGTVDSPFRGIFEGNGYTLSNLRVDKSNDVGLFSHLASDSVINGLCLLDVEVHGQQFTGGLVGVNRGTISNSYSRGQTTGHSRVGGLAGWNGGTISNSYSSGPVRGAQWVGGLVGENSGGGTVRNSYSNGQVTGQNRVGGLAGHNGGTMISDSYSIGQVVGDTQVGGLVGSGDANNTAASYWDITTSNLTSSAGGASKTTTELQSPTDATGIYSSWRDTEWDFGTAYQYPAIKYSTGTKVDYEACGRSQQPLCGALLGGAEWQIRRVAIATQTFVRVATVEGDAVVLDAYQGNLNYSWVQTGGTRLPLRAANTAELWFVVPSDLVVGKAATTGSLRFQLTVGIGDDTTQQTVLVVVTKVNNGESTIALGPIARVKNVLTLAIDSLPLDADGVASTSSIGYQWQLCLAGKNCSSDSMDWTNTDGMEASYSVMGTEARSRNRFRVVVEYRDRQGYLEAIVASNPISYSVSAVSSATTFTGMSWSQFVGGAKAVCDDDDIDNDNDGLIELCYLEDVDAIRYALDGAGYQFTADAPKITQGCGLGRCKGYELVRDLDFATDDSYLSTETNKLGWTSASTAGWQPIGDDDNFFEGIFEGNGHTLSNLIINKSSYDGVGLFSHLASAGTINGIGLLNVRVRGHDSVGGLVGVSRGAISNSYSSGQVEGNTAVGGLVGENVDRAISNSYSSGLVAGMPRVGGLVGVNRGIVSNSYSGGQVTGSSRVGGLVGRNERIISNSYSVAPVSASASPVGGLVGENSGGRVSESYWDVTVGNLLSSASGTSKTTTELQASTNTTDIYRSWSDANWDFGTVYQYPAIKYSIGTEAYEACGRSQQPSCGALLGGARWQIKRVAVATQTFVRVAAREGEAVVLNAYQGNFDYSWAQVSGTQLPLRAANTAELWFVVPIDLIDKTATTRSLEFRLTVSTRANTTQQTVRVVATKVNNDEGTVVLGPITRDSNVLTAPSIISLVDADGVGSTSGTGYRWQLCLAGRDCSSDSINWSDTRGTTASYSVAAAEARTRNRFRVVVAYNDGQGNGQEAISNPITYSISSVSSATTFTGMSWSQFVGGATAVCDDEDIDNDNDGLIELCYLEDVDTIRHALDGSSYQFFDDLPPSTRGCGSGGCKGYELVRDLDFATDSSYLSTDNKLGWTSGRGWVPVGDYQNRFEGFFEGNGYTLSNLRINRASGDTGLFSHLANGSVINGIGLLSVAVHGQQYTGSLVGVNRGTISNSYSAGQVTGMDYVGGLAAWNGQGGTISNSYNSGQVRGAQWVGGLVGENSGGGTISNSYSNGQVTGQNRVGGLAGHNGGTMISNSYSIGPVAGSSSVGGLVGSGNANNTAASYWDITRGNLLSSAGGTSKTTVELQSPTSTTGIYSTWSDAHWDFGTVYQYPAIKYSTGTKVDYEACGRSQQRLCGALLGGVEWQIRRVAIATQSVLQIDVLEGEAVVLDASQGNFNYSWERIGGTSPALKLNTTATAELWFVVPSDLISRTATTESLEFRLTVSAGTNTTQQTVQVIITKINNDRGTAVLGPITRADNVFTVSPIDSLPDADGAGSISSIRYQWQRCLIRVRDRCLDDSLRWTDSGVSTRVYSVAEAEAMQPYRFRIVARYRDGQGYTDRIISESTAITTIIPRSLATTFTGTYWSQFAGGATAVCDDSDIDNDNDGLIELCYLEDLNAIRHVLSGSAFQFEGEFEGDSQTSSTFGCGSGRCRGYELVRDLDFTATDSYFSAEKNQEAWTSGGGWQPIGGLFSGIFEGNGYTISNLTINTASNFVGLFSNMLGGTINGIGLLNVSVRGHDSVGGLVGLNSGGAISNSYSAGRVSGADNVGGLVAKNTAGGTISNSYSIGPASGNANVGGLVGWNEGVISNSYSAGQITGSFNVGGFVGLNEGSITSSYSVGQVTGSFNVGGFVGQAANRTTVTTSYWDITASNLIASVGGTSKTTVELQSPTSTTGIYSTWSDAHWDFGTAYQYPAIKYSTGTEAYEACGRSQQRFCSALLAGAAWQIRRVAIATQTFVRVTALEGDAVVLNAYQGNFDYSWRQTSGTQLPLRATSTAELWFVVPEALVGNATTAVLVFELTVTAGTLNTMSTQQTVQLVVAKTNNGDSLIVLEPIMQQGTVLKAPQVALLPDADGDGILSSIRYQWQKCSSLSSAGSCNRWVAVSGVGTNRSYRVPKEETAEDNRFRVQLSYTDGQGYIGKVFSQEWIYSYFPPAAILLRLKIFLEGALQ